MLERYSNVEFLSGALPSRQDFRPLPRISDREEWERIPDLLRKMIMKSGEDHLDFSWPELKATTFMENKRNGVRAHFETAYLKRRYALGALVLAECTENRGRFTDDIINGIWSLCEESVWWLPGAMSIAAAQRDLSLPDSSAPMIDLFTAETAALLSWTVYLMGPTLEKASSILCQRIHQELDRRLLAPYIPCQEYFWLGFSDHANSNWNAWINSNCLAVFLLMDQDEDRRIQGIQKTMGCIDRFIDAYPDDGGCDEGPNYWAFAGGMLLDYLDLMHRATKGSIDVFTEEKIRKIGNYINSVHISKDYFLNCADSPPRCHIPAGLPYRFGTRIGSRELKQLGLYIHEHYPDKLFQYSWIPMFRSLSYVFDFDEMDHEQADEPFVRDSWLEGIQVLSAREAAGSDQGYYLAAKGGTNGENHNHNDVGNYCVYYDGQPLLVDLGEVGYKEQHNSPQRYDIWNLQSAFHNLPTVKGMMQSAGKPYRASDVRCIRDMEETEISMNIAAAYPREAGLVSWKRTCRLIRTHPSHIEIVEDFVLEEATDDIVISMMAASYPQMGDDGRIIMKIDDRLLGIGYDGAVLRASIEKVDFSDNERLRAVWNDNAFRILFRPVDAVRHAEWHFIIDRNG